MVWTTADDVIAAWIGPDAPSDLLQIETWIAKAEREVRFRVPDIQDRITLGEEADLLATTVDVVTAMVHRVFRNPEGIRQVGVTTGPFSEQKTYGGDMPGSLYLTADELGRLAGTAGETAAAFTIDMVPTTSPYSGLYEGTYYPDEWWV